MNPVEPVPPGKMPKYSRGQNLHLSVRAAALLIMALLISGQAASAVVPNVAIQPTEMVITAKLNEPILLRLEITTTKPAADIDLKADGLRIQREIHNLDPTHHVFLIEPDTSQNGRVNGQIKVVDKTGAVLCAVPVTGQVQPYIHVSPPRIFLGSLEYGAPSARVLEYRIRLSADSAWELLGVDVSEMPDARWEIRNEDVETKELLLQFSEDAFEANAPFGAFIKRTLRLKTNNAAQPEIFVVIEGMLSHNATKRNFNTFVFKGNERWEGKWGTPNLAAAVLAPIVLLVLGYGAWLTHVRTKHPLLCRIAAVTLCICAVIGMFLLARTYSRGGWIAFGVGLGVMVALMERCRGVLGTGITIFILIIVFLPAGMQRAGSASALSEDQSIHHRFLVWRGALEMIADHPIRGVGAGQFGKNFQTYYQEPWHKDMYSTAINDYLTFAAERGMIPVLLVVGSVMCLATVAVVHMCRRRDIWLAPAVCALLTLGISSIFSSIECIWETRVLVSLGIGMLAIYCGKRLVFAWSKRRNYEKVAGKNIWIRGVCVGFAVNSFLGGLVACAAWMRPASYLMQQNVFEVGHTSIRLEYFPGKMVPQRGTLLFLSASQEPLTAVGRQILRPLAESGWRAVTLDLRIYDQEAAKQVVDALRDLEGPTLVLAEGARARVAVMAEQLLDSNHRPKLIFVDPIFFSSLGECDQSKAQKLITGAAIISGEQWRTFKQNGRNGLDFIIHNCDAVARRGRLSESVGLQAASYARP